MVVVKQPPGPKGHFLLGNIPDYRRGQLEFLERCSREYGDIVRLRLGYHRIFLVNHPDAIEEVLTIYEAHQLNLEALNAPRRRVFARPRGASRARGRPHPGRPRSPKGR